jgi:hypothetical protein
VPDLPEIPGGNVTLAAVGLLAVPGVRKQLRPIAKGAIHVGFVVADQLRQFVGEAREQAEDLVAEVRTERQANGGGRPVTESPVEQPRAERRPARRS